MSSSSQWRFVTLLLLGIGSLVFAGCHSDVEDFFEKEYERQYGRKAEVINIRKVSEGNYEVSYRFKNCSSCGGRGITTKYFGQFHIDEPCRNHKLETRWTTTRVTVDAAGNFHMR